MVPWYSISIYVGTSRNLLTLKKKGDGATLIVPRFMFTSDPDEFPFTLRRRQFPIRPAFAMTIHKSQGQTFSMVGIYLASPVFTHGMLYVAFSRVGMPTRIRVCIEPCTSARVHAATRPGHYTRNVVYHEVLRDRAVRQTLRDITNEPE